MNTTLRQLALGVTLAVSLAAPPLLVASSDATFDRNLTVSGPIRLELSNASGDVQIKAAANGAVHIHGDVHSSWSMLGNNEKRAQEVSANPPIEQKGDTIRVGKNGPHINNISIKYTIEVPHDTEVIVDIASGSVFVAGIRAPLRTDSASGAIRIEKIDRDATISTASGDITATDLSGYLKANTASGKITVSGVKGDVRANSASGDIRINQPGARADAQSMSGKVEIWGTSTDTTAQSTSGDVNISGDPGKSGYWKLQSVSGSVNLGVHPNSAFFLSAESMSGAIHADIPIVIEEQDKHSMRAHVGNGGARVEVRSVSGSINVRSAS